MCWVAKADFDLARPCEEAETTASLSAAVIIGGKQLCQIKGPCGLKASHKRIANHVFGNINTLISWYAQNLSSWDAFSFVLNLKATKLVICVAL